MENEKNIDGRTREGKAIKASGSSDDAPKTATESSKSRAEARIREIRG